jgi:hypothetical protein
MTTTIEDLIGLTEMANLLNLTKNQANAMRQKPGFPTPKIKFAMGPAWDRREVLEYAGKEGALEVRLIDGAMFANIRNTGCMQCNSMDIRVVSDGELDVTPDGVRVMFTYHCNSCQGDVDRYVDLTKEDA